MFLNGIISTTSKKSEEDDIKMLKFTTSNPMLDKENQHLFIAASILERLGHTPDLSINKFYDHLLLTDYDVEIHESITLAAVAIETMMREADLDDDSFESPAPTIH